MCHKIRCDEKSKKFYKISHELNKALIKEAVGLSLSEWYVFSAKQASPNKRL
jgi:hypothetical protein